MPLSPEFAASFGRLAANHLWQSTGFAAVAVLLALALRANHARARYWLWLAASVKFLVPFSALAAIGGTLGRWLAPTAPVSRVPFVMEQIVQPFAPIQDAAAPVTASASAPRHSPGYAAGGLALRLHRGPALRVGALASGSRSRTFVHPSDGGPRTGSSLPAPEEGRRTHKRRGYPGPSHCSAAPVWVGRTSWSAFFS